MLYDLIISKKSDKINAKNKPVLDKNTDFGENMKLSDINPYIRFARVFDKPVSRREIVGLDNRLFYCASGGGEITAANEKFPMTEGALLLIRAGIPYKNTSFCEGMKLYAFNFDFHYDERRPKNAVSYVFADEYRQNMLLEPLEEFEELGGRALLVRRFFHKDKLEMLLAEQDAKRRYFSEISSAVFKEILLLLAREATDGATYSKCDAILEYVRAHYREPLTNESVAAHFSYHKNYINAIVKKETGATLHNYLLNYRIERAAELLSSGEYSVSEAAEAVGFGECTHFSRAFKKITAKSPNGYIPKNKKASPV